jgi:hypothetical protein
MKNTFNCPFVETAIVIYCNKKLPFYSLRPNLRRKYAATKNKMKNIINPIATPFRA